jgi:hypothetical protein
MLTLDQAGAEYSQSQKPPHATISESPLTATAALNRGAASALILQAEARQCATLTFSRKAQRQSGMLSGCRSVRVTLPPAAGSNFRHLAVSFAS